MKHLKLTANVLILLLLILGGAGWLYLPPTPGISERQADLTRDGQAEKYLLKNGCLRVSQGRDTLWLSPPGWHVTQVVIADVNSDGKDEMGLVLWKYGSFGHSKPMWMRGKDRAVSCHLFIYGLKNGQLRPIWCSSALDRPIIRLRADVKSGTSWLEVTEGPPAGPFYLLRQIMARSQTRWQWKEWGFWRV